MCMQNKGAEFPIICDHVAVRVDHTIVVFGGTSQVVGSDINDTYHYQDYQLRHTIWIYNLYIEQWRRYRIPKWKPAPKDSAEACGVAIEEDIYTFFRPRHNGNRNELWKLTRNTYGCFVWTKIVIEEKHKKPSPRVGFSGWEYDRSICIFGGVGKSTDGYLNDYSDFIKDSNNQLLQFNPNKMEWTILKSSGTVPRPRSGHATTAINDKVWLYGGYDCDFQTLSDLYELDMPSLIWSKIHTGHPKGCFSCRLNVTTDSRLVLNGSLCYPAAKDIGETWIMDLPSQSWRLHSSDSDYPRYSHTGSLGINNNVILIGGDVEEMGTGYV